MLRSKLTNLSCRSENAAVEAEILPVLVRRFQKLFQAVLTNRDEKSFGTGIEGEGVKTIENNPLKPIKMTLVKWNNRNRSMFPSIWQEFDRTFGTPWTDKTHSSNTPAVNVKEGDASFTVEVAAPGFEKGDFNIELNDNLLKISSEKEFKTEDENEKFTRKEFSYSHFERSFFLPDNVNEEEISAKYEAGILNIEIPKKKEAIKKLKEIKIA